MGVLQFNGTSDRIRWTSLASALANASDGAFTIAVLHKRDSIPAATTGLVYMIAGANAEVGIGLWGGPGGITPYRPFMDISGEGTKTFTSILNNTTDSILFVVSKAAGTVAPRLGWKLEPAGAWTHENAGATLPDQTAADALEVGTWLNSEFSAAHIGLVGVWEGAMSDANKEALDDNWRTSDWWNSAHGQPVFLAEFNVAGASVVDLAGNASSPTVSGTTLDGAETLDSWNFDGMGAAPQILRPDADIATTGWTPTPLFSKINESSPDGTVITATAS